MKIILSIFTVCVLTLIFNSVISVYANQNDFQSEELVMRGEFKRNEPPKLILTYKIPYSITNGTIIDIVAKANNGIYATVNGTNTLLEIYIPKNYPVTNIPLYMDERFFVFVNGNEIIDPWELTKCFYHFSIPSSGASEIEIGFHAYASLDPYHALDVSGKCLPQTIEGYEIKYETWTNLRGESVLVFSSSVEKLIERGYLI